MGEIKRNSEVRWKKDKYLAGKPEPAKHFSRFYLEIILGSNLTILYNNNSSCILYCTNEACIKWSVRASFFVFVRHGVA